MEDIEDKPSKSQKKRDMDSLKQLATQLATLSNDDIQKIDDSKIIEAILAVKKITKGNARKRQIQYIAKLLSKVDITPIQQIVDVLDASSTHHLQHFHLLETWREQLIENDPDVMQHIFEKHPQADRPKLRALVRNAVAERDRGEQNAHYRKLFQFLKTLD